LLCGPRYEEMSLRGERRELTVQGTSAAFVLLHSPDAARSRVTLSATPGTDLQVTLLRLPADSGRLSVAVRRESGSVRLVLTAHDSTLALQEAVWERLVPSSRFEQGAVPDSGRIPLGTDHLAAGRSHTTPPFDIPDTGGPWFIKVAATDAAQRRVAGWAVIPVVP
jgi:hypothetical protein